MSQELEAVFRPLDPQPAERELYPAEGLIAQFVHNGNYFYVTHLVTDSNRALSKYTTYDQKLKEIAYSEGIHRIVGDTVHFTAISSQNLSLGTKNHVVYITRTMIEEVVLQSENLVWHSSPMLIYSGVKMYEGIMNDVQDKNSKYYKKLFIQKIPSRIDSEPTWRYSIEKCPKVYQR